MLVWHGCIDEHYTLQPTLFYSERALQWKVENEMESVLLQTLLKRSRKNIEYKLRRFEKGTKWVQRWNGIIFQLSRKRRLKNYHILCLVHITSMYFKCRAEWQVVILSWFFLQDYLVDSLGCKMGKIYKGISVFEEE